MIGVVENPLLCRVQVDRTNSKRKLKHLEEAIGAIFSSVIKGPTEKKKKKGIEIIIMNSVYKTVLSLGP